LTHFNFERSVSIHIEFKKVDGKWVFDAQDTKGMTISEFDSMQTAQFFFKVSDILKAISELLSS